MDWQIIIEYIPKLAEGAWLTFKLILVSGLIGIALALPIAFGRISPSRWINALPYAYIFFFRGTPLLVQIFLVYYGLAQFEAVRESIFWPWLKQPWWCAIVAFSLNTAAYIAEILRGALQAIPKGEIEACQVLGMSKFNMYRKVLLPRAFGMLIPSYGNEVILMLKGSALASTITLLDLTGMARTIIARTFTPVEIFAAAGVFYLLISIVIMALFNLLEKRYNAHIRLNQGH